MTHRIALPVLLALGTVPVAAQPAPTADERGLLGEVAIRAAELDPLRFLDVLRENRDAPRGVRMWPAAPAWVGREHLPALLALARSTEPVAVTCHVGNAHAVPLGVRSTLGREAPGLIKGHRRGYFHASCSNLGPPGDPDEAERRWAAGGATP